MGTQPVHHITNLQAVCPVNCGVWLTFDQSNIGHDHQQNSTALEVYRLTLRLPKYISAKLLHDLSGLPYVKDRLLSCAAMTLERISKNSLVEESITFNIVNPAWDRFPTPLSVIHPVIFGLKSLAGVISLNIQLLLKQGVRPIRRHVWHSLQNKNQHRLLC